jgi:uncharacterized protein
MAQDATQPSSEGSAAVDPPLPAKYFNDYAGVTAQETQEALNTKLASFDREAKCQVLVAIFPRKQSAMPLAEYCTQLGNEWGVGYKGLNNGVVLFVFIADHQMRISTGKGMAAVLPDAKCKTIIDQDIVPEFRKGDFDAGLTTGVNAIIEAIKAGELQMGY